MNNLDIKEIVVDLFCGFGGTTFGAKNATDKDGKNSIVVIACVNHDKNAILSHKANNPNSIHLTEDVRSWSVLRALFQVVKEARKKYPNAILSIWASLECTHFSIARGGAPKNADSRTLAEHLEKYIRVLRPSKLYIENVKEFLTWGPLDEDGKIIKALKGTSFKKWVKRLCNLKDFVRTGALNMQVDWKILNSADYGGCQTRRRLFMIFATEGTSINFPAPTHSKNGDNGLKKWVPVKTVLDLENHGRSIFERKKCLSTKTLERILCGLEKFYKQQEPQFIQQYFSGNPKSKVKSLNDPCPTVTSIDHNNMVTCVSKSKGKGDQFLTEYYGNGSAISIEKPIGTVTTKDRHAFISCQHIDRQYSGKHNNSSIDQPIGTIPTSPKAALVTSQSFLYNPQYQSKGRSIEDPCFTVIARLDKSPISLVTVTREEFQLPRIPTKEEWQNEPMKKILKFMAENKIVDIKMRMLTLPELLQIQGLPKDYKMVGTKAEKTKFIGNAVHGQMSQSIFESQINPTLSSKTQLSLFAS